MRPIAGTINSRQRILQAATDLFAEVGYSGASTRDIARMAAVNDATVYRHFSSKKVLFAAVLESELQKFSVRADLRVLVANAEGIRSALTVNFELLIEALAGQPRLLRLLQFSVLEFGSDLQPLYHKYLGALIDGAATYLESWQDRKKLEFNDPRAMVVAFAVTVVGLQTLYPLFGGEQISTRPQQENAANCAELWRAVLVGAHGVHWDLCGGHRPDLDVRHPR